MKKPIFRISTPIFPVFLEKNTIFWRFWFLPADGTGHYNEDINIEQCAQSRGMSVSWFLRNFKQINMKSPMQYFLNKRINNAVSLMEMTDYNVTGISTIVGYDNPLYFSRILKKQKGMSPLDYRRSLTGRQ